jgi:hypothetical protein
VNLEKYITPPTVRAIYDHYSASRRNGNRAHLGGSQIGAECARALWYSFRWAGGEAFSGRMLRLFETGDREEQRLIANLRAVGITVWSRDPETGRQWLYTAHGGHFGISLDGVGEGFAESSQPHLLEFKTSNDRGFATLQKEGLTIAKPVYHAQVQVGMFMAKLERAFFLCVNKNTDEIYGERVRIDRSVGRQMLARAESIVFAATPPARISEDPSFFKCKFCAFHSTCHGERVPDVSCRTCASVTPEPDGTWSCARHHRTLTTDEQRVGCPQHLFIPQAMPQEWEVVDASDDHVEYRTERGTVVNRENSNDLHSA